MTDLIFALLRAAAEGRRAEALPLDTAGWWALFRLAQQNRVAALTADALPPGVPREVLMPWLSEREKVAARHAYMAQVQDDITSRLSAHGIRTLVLKGTSLAQYWPRPEVRAFGDLDLYFRNRHAEADRVAREEMRVVWRSASAHHTKYVYRGVTVESHSHLLNPHYPPRNRPFEALLQQLLQEKPLPTTHYPLPTFHLLFLLRHTACHFAAGRITLREVCDWAFSVRALSGTADWEAVRHAIDTHGLATFAACLDGIAARRLGVASPLALPAPECLARVEADIVGLGGTGDHPGDGLGRLGWKVRRWHANAWKRRLTFRESDTRLLAASLATHLANPHSILHKQ